MSNVVMRSCGNLPGQRCLWVDCCRGICIVLVVYGHVVGGLKTSGDLAADSLLIRGRTWVYLFHMPAFFFLSGIFARKAADRSFWEMAQAKGRALIYPYVLWTGIYVGAQIVMGGYVNSPADIARALRLCWEPYGYGLWFLYALLIVSLVFGALVRARTPATLFVCVVLCLYVLSAANAFGFWPIFNQAMGFLPFYAFGAFLSRLSFSLGLGREVEFGAWMGIGGAALAMMTLMMVIHARGSSAWQGLTLVTALLGVVGVASISQGLVRAGLHRFWSVLGYYSLEIYLCHPLFGTAPRALLSRCGIHAPWAFVTSGVLAGVCASLALAAFCRRCEFPYLFRWPSRRSGGLPGKPALQN